MATKLAKKSAKTARKGNVKYEIPFETLRPGNTFVLSVPKNRTIAQKNNIRSGIYRRAKRFGVFSTANVKGGIAITRKA